jgi:predicted TIM-barrel fold metal-dependent hydrolase
MTNKKFAFIDSHVHFYDMQHPELHYGHWQPNGNMPLRELGNKNYLANDFIKDAEPLGMRKAIHVQAAIGSRDPVAETKWLQNIYEETGIPNGIVGHVDLRSSNARQIIENHMNYKNFKGIRDFSYGDYLTNSAFRRGFKLLEEYNLVASIHAEWPDMSKLSDLAMSYPNITIVLDHAGSPKLRTTEYFEHWKNEMKTISELDNVICKVSGLAMGDHNWTIQSIKPYVETCIELFGISKTIFATNWPVDGLWSDYSKVINAYKELTKSFSNEEKDSFFFKNAENIYDI